MTFKEMQLAKNHGFNGYDGYSDGELSIKEFISNQSAILKLWFSVMVVTFALIVINF